MGQKKTKERKKIKHIRGIKKKHFNVILMMRSRIHYKEEGGDFLPNLGCMNVMNSRQIHDSKLASFSLITSIVKLVYVTCLWGACVYVILS